MTRARPYLLLPLLAITVLALAVAACETQRKPIRGFDEPPPGSFVLDGDPGGMVTIWPIFDLPTEPQTFRPRLDGQDLAYETSDEGFYDYVTWMMQGWTGGWDNRLAWIPPDTYVVELVDSAGQSWGKSAPLAIPAGSGPYMPSGQDPAVVFINFDGQTGSWTIDPATQDADMATDEITVTNLLGEDVVVERCTIADRRTDLLHGRRHRRAASRPAHGRDDGGLVEGRPPGPLHPPRERRQSVVPAGPRGGGRQLRFHLPDRADPRPRHTTDPRVQPDGHHGVRDVHLLRKQQWAVVGC